MPRVLLVADTAWVANEVNAALGIGGWEVVHIDNPRLTRRTIVEQRIDAVIVDMQVGSMGGMAVTREVRQNFDPGDRPRTILLLDRSADRFIAGRAGADECILKPINAAELRAALGHVDADSPTPKVTPRRAKGKPRARSEEE